MDYIIQCKSEKDDIGTKSSLDSQRQCTKYTEGDKDKWKKRHYCRQTQRMGRRL